MTARPRVDVVAAVLQQPDGRFLLAQRPRGKVYAGYWEFPGGKVEPGEAPVDALKRELHEELGIEVLDAYPWLTREHEYEHAAVRLRFFRVTAWTGTLQGREQQAFAWQHIDAVDAAPVLPANGPIMRALALPTLYGVSDAHARGIEAFIQTLHRAVRDGLRLVQVREKAMATDELIAFAQRVLEVCRPCGAKVLLNAEPAVAREAGVDGVHLTAERLLRCASRPPFEWIGASCHSRRELEHACAIGADLAVLGPVNETATHPGAQGLGWPRFSEIASGHAVPVYAIGGLSTVDLEDAWRAGAHGVAAIRSVWR